jgi:hypothetical protein
MASASILPRNPCANQGLPRSHIISRLFEIAGEIFWHVSGLVSAMKNGSHDT